MITFLSIALGLNLVTVALLFAGRHRIARLPAPGVWWLAAVTLATVLTLHAARIFLP